MQTAADPLLGQVLEGRYRIRARLAVGGMSTVYSALDERLDREVAVKVMTRTLSEDPAFVDRFSREARAAARLSHVNAVAVYDQGSDAGNVFLVMELVRGRTLRDLLRERGILSPAEAVSIMTPVLLALAAAHQAGLVHRDVKPENILLSDDGVVKVADFGLARADETHAAARTSVMMGTVAYSSPEQFRGRLVDKRSDVYSAGIVLFELLTGSPPYQGPDAMAVAYQHVHNDVPPPSTRQPGVAPPLDQVVLRATARDPAHRPADAGALLAQLIEARDFLHLPVIGVPRRPTAPRHPPLRHQTSRIPSSPPPPPGRPNPGRPNPGRPASGRTTGAITAPTATGTTGPVHRTAPGGVQHTRIETPREPVRRRPTAPPVSRRPRDAGRHRRRTIIGAVVILLLCAALIAGAWWFASGRYSAVADVRTETVASASAELRKDGFTVAVDPAQPSDTVPVGQVISTEPPGGRRQVRGRTVHIVPSSGPTYFAVPTVAGRTQAAALTALGPLQNGGVTVTVVQRADDTVPAGTVISTSPAAGTKLRRGQSVIVTVSTGPPILSVPDVGGRSQDDATKALTGMGFKVASVAQFSDTVDSGQVISQNPAAAAPLRKGSTVTLTVSKGPDLVKIPSLPRLDGVDDARKKLEDLGFTVRVNKAFGGFSGLVVGMDPSSGTMARRGSTVTLTII